MKPHLAKFVICLTICAAALLLSNQWCLAQDPCPNDGQVMPSNEETLASQYQPYPSGTPPVLRRYRFVPPGAWPPNKTFPTVLMLPPDVFRDENITDEGTSTERQASYNLQFAGFSSFRLKLALRLRGCCRISWSQGMRPCKPTTSNVRFLPLADPQCNGNIYLVGGSAGGTLALWCALDPAGTVSGWNETARSHIKAVVSMSGPTQLCDWNDPGGIPPDVLMRFEMDVDNYVNLTFPDNCDPNCDFGAPCALDQASPAWLVTHGATSSPPPIILYSTTGDRVPNTQATDMLNALRSQFPSLHVEKYKMTYSYGSTHDHAYKYWHALNNDMTSDGLCVSQEVINFLQAH